MRKTAMQELIEWIKDYEDGYIFYGAVMDEAIELLNKEKEQIRDAWEAGELFGERVERDGMNHTQVIQVRAEYLKTYNHE